MLVIQPWRWFTLMVGLFLAIAALSVNALDPAFVQPSSYALVQSYWSSSSPFWSR